MNHEIGGSSGNQTAEGPDENPVNEWIFLDNQPNWDELTEVNSNQSEAINAKSADFSHKAFELAYSEINNRDNPNIDFAQARRVTDIFQQIQSLVAQDKENGQKEDLAAYQRAFNLFTADIESALKITEKRPDAGDSAIYYQKLQDIDTAKQSFNKAYRSLTKTPEKDDFSPATFDSPSEPTINHQPKPKDPNEIVLPGDVID